MRERVNSAMDVPGLNLLLPPDTAELSVDWLREHAEAHEWSHLDDEDFAVALACLHCGHPGAVVLERLWRWHQEALEAEERYYGDDLDDDDDDDYCPHCGRGG